MAPWSRWFLIAVILLAFMVPGHPALAKKDPAAQQKYEQFSRVKDWYLTVQWQIGDNFSQKYDLGEAVNANIQLSGSLTTVLHQNPDSPYTWTNQDDPVPQAALA